jgi:hypothetical protein
MTSRADDVLARLASRQHGVFALEHVETLQFSDAARMARVSSGRWTLVYDGVYRMGGAPTTWQGDLLAACFAAGPNAVASHHSAAALWSLPSGRTDVSELMCPRWKSARQDRLVVHESLLIDDCDKSLCQHVPCTSVARTLFDLARKLSPVMLDANIDTAVRRGLVSVTELQRTAERLATKGRPGGRRFRAAVEARSVTSALPESVPERLLANMLVRQGLLAPVHQFMIRDDSGGFVARVDLAYPEWMIVVEYDSIEHHTGTAAHIRDSARRDAIGDLGYAVLTATSADLNDRGARIAASIRRRRERVG